MAIAEREPITGVWGQSPQRGPRAEPLARRSGSEAPLKLVTLNTQSAFPALFVWHFALVQRGCTVHQICKFGPKVTHTL